MSGMSELYRAAVELHTAGMNVVPVRHDGTKAPALRAWQDHTTTPEDLAAWFGGDQPRHHAAGVVCGAPSGGLEMLEIEGAHVDHLEAVGTAAGAAGLLELWERINDGWCEQSPSGGIHWFYRVEGMDVPGNTKLAATADRQVIAETRGAGGQTVVAPSSGTTHRTGRPWERLAGGPATVPTLTAAEREALHALFRALDQTPAPAVRPAAAPDLWAVHREDRGAGPSVLDDYEQSTTWADVLEPHGWTMSGTRGTETLWTRPGKDPRDGFSATTGYADDRDRLYVFSTSTPFEVETPYTRPGALAVLEYGGDHARMAAALADRGYGTPNRAGTPPSPAAVPGAAAVTLDDVHQVFRRWLGDAYDVEALGAVLAAAAVERLDGDPLWLLTISGSGNAKTETVNSLTGAGAVAVSTIASEGALLSATSRKERGDDATGGLLRQIGGRGLLVIKDVTSILSMSRDQRAAVLAALREVYDGQWTRTVGTDGGRTLEWVGRLCVIGAVTTAWDSAHAVIAAMGDRFVLVRMDSTQGRRAAGLQAINNTGAETTMRRELAEAVAGLFAGLDTTPARLTEAETVTLLAAADLVTLARTAVERDYQGNVIDAHAPEMPTRFAKQLAQIVRGGLALGMDRDAAMRLAVRCARDSMPPLRLLIVDDVAEHPGTSTTEVRRRLGKPRATVDRELQALHMLGVLTADETSGMNAGREVTVWRYTLAEGIDPEPIRPAVAVPEMAGGGHTRSVPEMAGGGHTRSVPEMAGGGHTRSVPEMAGGGHTPHFSRGSGGTAISGTTIPTPHTGGSGGTAISGTEGAGG